AYQRRPTFAYRLQEILDLQGMVVRRRVTGLEARTVFGLELGEQVLLVRDGPEVVESRLLDPRHAGDECGPATGLDANRRAVRSMHVYLAINSRPLRH